MKKMIIIGLSILLLLAVFGIGALYQMTATSDVVINTTASSVNSVTYELSEMSNGLTEENLSYTKNQSYLRYFTIPRNSSVTAAILNITGLLPGTAITNCTDLQDIEDDLTATYYLDRDIDCIDSSTWNSGEGFKPIGNATAKFTGVLNGNGKVVTNLYINRTTNNTALFGIIESATIKNIGIEDANITSSDEFIAGLVAEAFSSTIKNSYVTGKVNSTVLPPESVWGGMLIGEADNTIIENCYAVGKIGGTRSYVGGLVGYCDKCNITDSYSNVNITGLNILGGLAGRVIGTLGSATINNSYALGWINTTTGTAGGNIGGITGWYETTSATILNCYYNNRTDFAYTCHGSPDEAEDCTAVQDNEAYFHNVDNEPMLSWDFNIWNNTNDDTDFPVLIETGASSSDVTIDVGNDGDIEFGHYGNLTSTNQTSDFSSEINDYVSSCTADGNGNCDVPFNITSSDGETQIDSINITYDYNATYLFERNDTYTWNNTRDEPIGLIPNAHLKRRYSIQPTTHLISNDLNISAYYLRNDTATECEINNIARTVTSNYCEIAVNYSQGDSWATHYIWDNNISTDIPINWTNQTFTVSDIYYYNDTLVYMNPDLSIAPEGLFTNVTVSYYFSDEIVEDHKLEYYDSGTWYDITPEAIALCSKGPVYTRKEVAGRVFHVCMSTEEHYLSYKIESSN